MSSKISGVLIDVPTSLLVWQDGTGLSEKEHKWIREHVGKRISLEKCVLSNSAEYFSYDSYSGCRIREDWLTDTKEDFDWSSVNTGDAVEVYGDSLRYFVGEEDDTHIKVRYAKTDRLTCIMNKNSCEFYAHRQKS